MYWAEVFLGPIVAIGLAGEFLIRTSGRPRKSLSRLPAMSDGQQSWAGLNGLALWDAAPGKGATLRSGRISRVE
jgi:hypothetical protein